MSKSCWDEIPNPPSSTDVKGETILGQSGSYQTKPLKFPMSGVGNVFLDALASLDFTLVSE